MKEEIFEQHKDKFFDKWNNCNGFLGVKREKLKSFLDCRPYLKKIILAKLRKDGWIMLEKRYYYKLR